MNALAETPLPVCDWCEEPAADRREDGTCPRCHPNECDRCGRGMTVKERAIAPRCSVCEPNWWDR